MPSDPGPAPDDFAVRFTIRQMAIGIAVLGFVLALAVQVPWMLVAAGDALLIGFGAHKLARALFAKDGPKDEPAWFRVMIATVLAGLILGRLIGWLYPIASHRRMDRGQRPSGSSIFSIGMSRST